MAGELLQAVAPVERGGRGAVRQLDLRATGVRLGPCLGEPAALDRERIGERRRRQKRHGFDVRVRRAGTIDPAHALSQPGGTPRDVVMDHPHGVLQVQPFAQHVGREQDIGLECGAGPRAALRQRRERAQHGGPARALRAEPSPVSHHRGHAVPVQSAEQVPDGGSRLYEHDRLPAALGEHPLQGVGLRVGAGHRELAQPSHRIAIRVAHRRVPGRQEQREERELQIVLPGGEEALEVRSGECASVGRGGAGQLEPRPVSRQARAQRGDTRRELRQQQQPEQGRRFAARVEPGDAGDELLEQRVGRRAEPQRRPVATCRERERDRACAPARPRPLARAGHAQPGGGGRERRRVGVRVAARRAAQRGDAQGRELVVAQKQP